MSRSKKNWNELVDRYGNYDFTSIFRQVDGVSQESLDQQLSSYVSRSGDIMSGGLFVQNDLGYAYAIEPGGTQDARRPAGTTEFTRNGRVIAEQYWDIAEQRLNFNVRDVNGSPQLEDSLEIGRDRIRINAECDLNGDLFIKGDSLSETLGELSQEINYQVGLLEGKIATKYNKTGGDISGVMSVSVGGDTKFTVNRLGVTLGQAPTQNFHAATKKYVDDAIEGIDFTGALKFLGVRDLTTVDPDGDEEFGNIYAASLDGTPTAAWGLSADVTEGTLVGLGENGWIVIGEVGLPDLSGYVTIVDSETADGLLSDRLDLLELDPTTQGQLDTVNQNLSLRLEVLEQDPITKSESDEGDKALSDRITVVENDYVPHGNYLQDQADLADTLSTFLTRTGDKIEDASSNVNFEWNKNVEFKSLEGLYLKATNNGNLTTDQGTALTWSDSGVDFNKKNISNIDYIYFDSETKLRFTDTEISFYSLENRWYTKDKNGLFFHTTADSDLREECHAKYYGAITDDNNIVTKKYVDDKVISIGDVLVFKGTVDFTTTEAPEGVTGHVYSNSGTGPALASWGVGEVTPGQLFGFGETQWGIIGAGEVDLTGHLPLTGGTLTGDLRIRKTENERSKLLFNSPLGASVELNNVEVLSFYQFSGGFHTYHNSILYFQSSDDSNWFFRSTPGGPAKQDCFVEYLGKITEDSHITNKGYVDTKLEKNFANLPELP